MDKDITGSEKTLACLVEEHRPLQESEIKLFLGTPYQIGKGLFPTKIMYCGNPSDNIVSFTINEKFRPPKFFTSPFCIYVSGTSLILEDYLWDIKKATPYLCTISKRGGKDIQLKLNKRKPVAATNFTSVDMMYLGIVNQGQSSWPKIRKFAFYNNPRGKGGILPQYFKPNMEYSTNGGLFSLADNIFSVCETDPYFIILKDEKQSKRKR